MINSLTVLPFNNFGLITVIYSCKSNIWLAFSASVLLLALGVALIYEHEEATPSVEVAAKIADTLAVSLDYLVGNTDIELDKTILDEVIAIQKLPEEDKTHIMYSLDGLIQHAKTRIAYK